jgi:hypothetical protein
MRLPMTKIYDGADVSGATANLAYLPITTDGVLRSVIVKTDTPVAGAPAVFKGTKNGVNLASLNVTIPIGDKLAKEEGLNVTLNEDDEIIFELFSGAASSPISFTLVFDDGNPYVGQFRTAEYVTESIAATVMENGEIEMSPSYEIHQIQTNYPARVRFYTKSVYRTADAARAVGDLPTGEHGVVADFVTDDSNLILDCSPIPSGTNREAFRTGDISIAVQNRDTVVRVIIVTVKYLVKEVE